MKKFSYRIGEYEASCCDNTIEIIKWLKQKGEEEYCIVLGRFYYNKPDDDWELKLMGFRMKEINDWEKIGILVTESLKHLEKYSSLGRKEQDEK